MKPLFVFVGVIVATAYAALKSSNYLPTLDDENSTAASNLDLQSIAESASSLADDGYRYKTVKRLRLRQRRDVNELPATEYLPALIQSEPAVADIPVLIEIPAEAAQDSAALTDDGYHYKTVKRIRYRHRRNAN